jgi:hypothetical protein
MKYLSNTIKMTAVAGILFFGLAIQSKSDESTINQIKNIPGKVVDVLNSEVAKTKEYQKAQFQDGKKQVNELVSKVKSESLNIIQVADAFTKYFSIYSNEDDTTPTMRSQFENKYNNIKIESHYMVKDWKEDAKDYWLNLQGKKEEKMAGAKKFFNSLSN